MRHGTGKRKLIMVKLIHTIIWVIMVAAILYICYAGVFDRVNTLVWVCAALIVVEGIVLFVYKWSCPLTILARNYTDNHPVGFDIFLPPWLAKHNKTIFTSLFVIGLLLVVWRMVY